MTNTFTDSRTVMFSDQNSDVLINLNRENAKTQAELNSLQAELAALSQSPVTVSVEPDTTCSSYSEDTEVAVETDITIKRFRCKQLRAEIDVVAQKELTLLPQDNNVRYTALHSDLQQLTSELKDCLAFNKEQEKELQNDIDREKKTSTELEATISAAKRKLSETGHQKESKKEVHKRLEERCKKLVAANKEKQKHMIKFVEKYYPLPDAESYKKVAKKIEHTTNGKLSQLNDLLPLKTIIERLINASLDSPNDPYIDIDDSFWPPYIELLLQCDIALRHSSDIRKIKLVPFHL